MSARILVVEDDESLRFVLVDNLEEAGFAVTEAATGEAALEAVGPAGEGFDAIILDIMLPGIDGYRVCQTLRARGCTAGVLMLTARTLEDDLVRGLDEGADDYLAKPYRLRELMARVRALLRRRVVPETPEASARPMLKLGGFNLDPDARAVTDASGAEVTLTRTEFDLLAFLIHSEGRALSRDAILDAVWGVEVVVDTRTVDNFVHTLKKKLRWSQQDPWRILTVRGVGYRLVIDDR